MTYKQIEASREIRLWIGQIVVPVIGFGIMIAADPEKRRGLEERIKKAKRSIKKVVEKTRKES